MYLILSRYCNSVISYKLYIIIHSRHFILGNSVFKLNSHQNQESEREGSPREHIKPKRYNQHRPRAFRDGKENTVIPLKLIG